MSSNGQDNEREERILMEVVVDAYGMEERALGWYYYLDDKISFPFVAECFVTDNRSPLIPGEQITVYRMANEGNWSQSQDMYVEISWNERTFAVPLAQLTPINADDATVEAIYDWHYWKSRGYLF